ncbi:flagellar basal-body MS-ring/collar protein FliF [Shewanella sp. C32]|uniref:Flagellar M-ring protein n=1 Tax=Shewanella electrica TaxID=515560 RepID=A0ABT2FJI4_9GAMM|nr:flagellar basal-body MS-ring/collar protein FliF [Shewanella electrica]MCH1923279.1 flagellar M-ring protein FliF [Shewanella electrica]MCS4555376.1 flagellar basal-body MS-ring/collar protein FliF [Shewanella electrica]
MKDVVATKDGANFPSRANSAGLREKVVNLSGRFGWPQNGDRSLASIALLATLVAAAIVIILWTSAKNYVPLYGNQEHYDKASILEILDKDQVPFRIDTDTGNIMVPSDKLADARITLAARGIKAALPDGLNSLTDKVKMGASQFMETKQYQHALEGELARTIMNMAGIQNARVHLAIPKRSLFIGRKEETASASVMVDLAPGYELKQPQVEAIVSLVVGSVPGMDQRAVSVVDQKGELLTAELFDTSPVGKESSKKLQFIDKLERNIEQRAAIMLLPIVGEGNYRIQVSADVDFSVVEETKQTLDPNTVVISENTKSGSSEDQLAMGIPGSLANQPPVAANAQNQNQNGQQQNNDGGRTNQRQEAQRKFDSGRSVTHTQYEVGRLKSISISVLVNEAVKSVNGEGETQSSGWTDAQLASLGNVVKTAAGYDEARGDKFNISTFPFVTQDVTAVADETPWWQLPMVGEYARYLFGTLIALALIFFGVRPLVNHLVKGKRDNHAPQLPDTIHDQQFAANNGNGQANSDGERDNGTGSKSVTKTELMREEPIQAMALPEAGALFEEQVAHMQYLANKESERVTAVIKTWVERGIEIETRKS